MTPGRQLGGGGVVGAHTSCDGGMAEPDGEHGLADAGRSDQQHVGGVFDEAQCCELGDEFRISGWLRGEVEVGERER